MDILKHFYYLVDENLTGEPPRPDAERVFRALLTEEQESQFDHYQEAEAQWEDKSREILFYAAIRLGIILAAGDSHRP